LGPVPEPGNAPEPVSGSKAGAQPLAAKDIKSAIKLIYGTAVNT